MSIRRATRARHVIRFALALVAIALFAAGCGGRATGPTTPMDSASSLIDGFRGTPALHRAIDAQEQATPMLLGIPGVVGTSAGLDASGHGVVRVLLERGDVPGIPATVNGLKVRKVVTGPFRGWSLTGAYRPIAIGVSVGNALDCIPGTIGCIVSRGNDRFVLSANHVLARQDNGQPGETIVQPSLPDLDPANCTAVPDGAAIAELTDFQYVYYDGKTPNTMDAAIADITLPTSQISTSTPRGYYGAPGVTPVPATLGMPVMKLGRTSGLTHAIVTGVNVKVKLTFPSGVAYMVGQLETSRDFGAFGDSGALTVTDDSARSPIGLVIGGDAQGRAIVTPIDRVLTRFGVRISAAVDDRTQ